MNTDDDVCTTCTFWQRVGAYVLLRLREPTTWAGLFGIATGIGVRIAPELQADITQIGTGVVLILLMAAREGRNKPDNPSIAATVTGTMPQSKPAIVPPPAPASTVAIDPDHVPVDAAGELQAPPK